MIVKLRKMKIKIISILALLCLFVVSLFSFTPTTTNSSLSGEALAKQYCGSCHIYTAPDLLDKKTWKESVLPNMGWRLGIRSINDSPYASMEPDEAAIVEKLRVYPNSPIISKSDWQKIVDFYITKAPATVIPAKITTVVKTSTRQFFSEPVFIDNKQAPKTSMIKFDDANATLYVSDAINELYALDKYLKLKETWNTPSAVVDLLFEKNKEPSALCIGSIAPSEKKEGLLLSLDSTQQKASFGGLARPVNIEKADVNQDGKEDIIICQFGNHTGKISWLDGGDIRKENILVYRPGARKAEIVDLNKDGKLDIVVMMAQAYEGIYYLENKGGGTFKETPLVKFPPVYGVSYFEMIDINKDGFLDIVMSNGDNWDLSRVKKRFHGVRILLNDKLNHFKESFFFPMYGASKAVARDFDGDGDLDIAAISFYDDLAKPEQGFIYFENTGNMQFAASTTPEAANGKWLTMEVADIDKDGDTDIVLGSFIYTFSEMTQLLMKGIEHFPQLLVLRNNKK
jgi:hypothetical protein